MLEPFAAVPDNPRNEVPERVLAAEAVKDQPSRNPEVVGVQAAPAAVQADLEVENVVSRYPSQARLKPSCALRSTGCLAGRPFDQLPEPVRVHGGECAAEKI
jgi:hypothetical protein